MNGTESLIHAPDCNCHRCSPYSEWLGAERSLSAYWRRFCRFLREVERLMIRGSGA